MGVDDAVVEGPRREAMALGRDAPDIETSANARFAKNRGNAKHARRSIDCPEFLLFILVEFDAFKHVYVNILSIAVLIFIEI